MNSVATGGVSTDMASLQGLVGAELGPTDWAEMTQEAVNRFAALTGDDNFLHVDPERARATPFGGPIAHGLLTLALLAPVTQRLHVSDAAMSVNYGIERVRFPAPLPVGAMWRSSAEVLEATDVSGGVQVRLKALVAVKGSEKPAVVAEFLIRFYS